jgi:hypothetical protein
LLKPGNISCVGGQAAQKNFLIALLLPVNALTIAVAVAAYAETKELKIGCCAR